MSKELPHFSLKRYLYPIFMFPVNDIYLINKASNVSKSDQFCCGAKTAAHELLSHTESYFYL